MDSSYFMFHTYGQPCIYVYYLCIAETNQFIYLPYSIHIHVLFRSRLLILSLFSFVSFCFCSITPYREIHVLFFLKKESLVLTTSTTTNLFYHFSFLITHLPLLKLYGVVVTSDLTCMFICVCVLYELQVFLLLLCHLTFTSSFFFFIYTIILNKN